jgi:uncharacterized protein with ParB-like and HNH nuclease domain
MYFGKHATNHGYPIIDGQQRFTTILLILKKINEKLLEQKKCSERFNEINFDNFKISLRYDSKYYELFPTFNDGEAKNNNLMECYGVNLKNAKKIIEESLAGKNLEKILKSIVNNLYFLFIQCEDDRSEKILFRLINAKGKRLDDIDNIKACLLSDIYTTDEDTSKFMKL